MNAWTGYNIMITIKATPIKFSKYLADEDINCVLNWEIIFSPPNRNDS